MTRPYFVVFGANTFTKAKWRKTPMVVRGALLTLWMLSSMQADEGRWSSREALEADLDAEGCPKVKDVVDRLTVLGWVECRAEGCVVHDWNEWQPRLASSAADRKRAQRERDTVSDIKRDKDAAARRKRAQRKRESEAASRDVTLLRDTAEMSLGEERRGDITSSSLRSLETPTSTTKPKTPRQTVHGWMTAHKIGLPVGWANASLNEAIRAYGAEAVVAAMDSDTVSKTSNDYVRAVERALSPTPIRNGKPAGHTRPVTEIEHAFEH